MKLMVDARYTRIGFHDGISRYTASLLGALKTLIDTGDEAAADLDLTMIISDERQLDMLPDLPHVKICSPTGPLEPTASLQLNKYAPDVVFSPMQTIRLHRTQIQADSHPARPDLLLAPDPARVPARTGARGLAALPQDLHPAALPAQSRRRGRDGF